MSGKKKKAQPKSMCQFCAEIFSGRIKRHERTCPLNPSESSDYVCNKCQKYFSRPEYLNKHKARCSTQKRSLVPCMFVDCGMEFTKKLLLIDHLEEVHKSEIKSAEILKFNSIVEFELWKDEEEENTYSYFTQKSGSHGGKTYFYCQKDGSSKSHHKNGGGNKTSRKLRAGQLKTDKKCIAMINLQVKEDETCLVKYFPTHSHPLQFEDVKRHPQTLATYNLIDTQLALNISPTNIVKNLKNKGVSKANFVSRNLVRLRLNKMKSFLKLDVNKVKSEFNLDEIVLSEKGTNQILMHSPLREKCITGSKKDIQTKIVRKPQHINSKVDRPKIVANLENRCNSKLQFANGEESDHLLNSVCSTVNSLEKQCKDLSGPSTPSSNIDKIDSTLGFPSKETLNTQVSPVQAFKQGPKRINQNMMSHSANKKVCLKQEVLDAYQSLTPVPSKYQAVFLCNHKKSLSKRLALKGI